MPTLNVNRKGKPKAGDVLSTSAAPPSANTPPTPQQPAPWSIAAEPEVVFDLGPMDIVLTLRPPDEQALRAGARDRAFGHLRAEAKQRLQATPAFQAAQQAHQAAQQAQADRDAAQRDQTRAEADLEDLLAGRSRLTGAALAKAIGAAEQRRDAAQVKLAETDRGAELLAERARTLRDQAGDALETVVSDVCRETINALRLAKPQLEAELAKVASEKLTELTETMRARELVANEAARKKNTGGLLDELLP